MKVTVYWLTKDKEAIRKICDKFSMPRYTSVNGETEADIPGDLMPLLQECERRGYVKLRRKHQIKPVF